MSDVSVPTVSKWPFLLGDLLLVAVAVAISWQCHVKAIPNSPSYVGLIVAAVALGAWLLCRPFLVDHETAVRATEQTNLAGTLAQIRHLEGAGQQISGAVAQLAAAGNSFGAVEAAARELSTKLAQERLEFTQFLTTVNDQEKQVTRLEIEKLRRGEQEGLQVIVHLLDHTFALFQAGARSGQPGLMQQLGNFRSACLDAVRRLGVVAHEAEAGAAFNPEIHESHDGQEVPPGTLIAGTFACGYTFRGTPLRRMVVVTQDAAQAFGGQHPVAGVGGPNTVPPASAS